MCGIAALFSMKNIERNYIKKMTDVIKHRGPDAFGHEYFENDKWQLGHRRLSILDISEAGKQPMMYCNGKYWITFNGEIYNYIELRNELEAKGYIFHTNTDTEVILASYACWGKDCLRHFNGMWAFVIIDTKERKSFISRDRFGVKPLYYYYSLDGVLAFASEIKQFTVLPGWHAGLNVQRSYDFLVWGQLDHTNETMFCNVYQIRRGEAVELDLDELGLYSQRLPVYSWYDLNYANFDGTIEEAVAEFRRLFIDSVSIRLRSDVKVGSCLSGGLDSSSIVCVINDLLRKDHKNDIQETVSACAKIKKYDEREYIDDILSDRNIKGYHIYPEFEGLFDTLDDIVWHQEEPFGSTSIYAQWCVYKEAAFQGLKVMLDGQGADESLLGYHSSFGVLFSNLFTNYRWNKLISEIQSCSRRHNYSYMFAMRGIVSNLFPEYVLNKLKHFYDGRSNVPDWLNLHFMNIQTINPIISEGRKITSLKEWSYSELMQSNLQQLLHYADRDSMAHSVETRLPFLDYRLVEFIINLPDEYKLSEGITKKILRNSMKGILPEKVRMRMTKLGFVTPEEIWMRENNEFFRKKIKNAIEYSDGVLNDSFLTHFDNVINRRRPFDSRMWRGLSFGYWMRRFSIS